MDLLNDRHPKRLKMWHGYIGGPLNDHNDVSPFILSTIMVVSQKLPVLDPIILDPGHSPIFHFEGRLLRG